MIFFMSNKFKFLEIVIGIIIACFLINSLTRDDMNFDEFALGPGTSSFYAKHGGLPIHLGNLEQNLLDSLELGWLNRGKNPVLFILGNSQTHGINQLKKGDVSYNSLLFDKLQTNRLDVLTHSLPNVSLQEFFLSYTYFQEKYPIKFLLIPAFMDDLRENGIRKNAFASIIEKGYMLDDTIGISEKINTEINKLREELLVEGLTSSEERFLALNETVQQKSERFLNKGLNQYSISWKGRKQLRGKIFTNLYLLRNTMLGIDAQTKRPMISQNYKNNIAALTCLLEHAQYHDIKVLIYIPPIRNDVEPPYILKEYSNFKKEMKGLSARYNNTYFVNLESIVAAQFWGTKEATSFSRKDELDFMHFQKEGHVILYENLLVEIDKMIE